MQTDDQGRARLAISEWDRLNHREMSAGLIFEYANAIRNYLNDALKALTREPTDADVKRVARAIDPEIWGMNAPLMIKSHVEDWHHRRQKSCRTARAAILAMEGGCP